MLDTLHRFLLTRPHGKEDLKLNLTHTASHLLHLYLTTIMHHISFQSYYLKDAEGHKKNASGQEVALKYDVKHLTILLPSQELIQIECLPQAIPNAVFSSFNNIPEMSASANIVSQFNNASFTDYSVSSSSNWKKVNFQRKPKVPSSSSSTKVASKTLKSLNKLDEDTRKIKRSNEENDLASRKKQRTTSESSQLEHRLLPVSTNLSFNSDVANTLGDSVNKVTPAVNTTTSVSSKITSPVSIVIKNKAMRAMISEAILVSVHVLYLSA